MIRFITCTGGIIFLLYFFFYNQTQAQHITPEDFDLIELQSINPKIIIDLKYATPDNFTKEIVYTFKTCYVKSIVAQQLNAVQHELQLQGMGLKVWDGFRPMSAQKRFWELVPDPRYVSPPGKGGRHTRGTAVDLTLVNLKGEELLMPTAYDDFSIRAHKAYMKLPEMAIYHRSLLQNIMSKYGFEGLKTEWWHFDYHNWQQFPPIPLTMEQLVPQKKLK